MHHLPLLSTVSVASALAPLFINALVGIVMLYAAVRVVRTPREWFQRGLFSKAVWFVIALWLTWQSAGIALPIGALFTLWYVRSLARRQQRAGGTGVPFAAGEPLKPRDNR